MAVVGQEAVAVPAAPKTRRGSKARQQRRVAGGALWIVLAGILLAGVVALNVAVLQLNLRLDDLGRERTKLRAENAELASQISSAAANAKIQQDALHGLGVVPADPSQTTYVHVR
jgi:cell division protein FtsL